MTKPKKPPTKKSAAKPKAKKPSKSPVKLKKVRCEAADCFRLVLEEQIVSVAGEFLCRVCAAMRPKPKPARDLKKMLWYGVACDPGREVRIRRDILRRAKIADLDHLFGQIIIPTHKEEKVREDGKPVTVNRKSFRGYFVVQADMTDDAIVLIHSTRDVFGVLPLKPKIRGLKRYAKQEPPASRKPQKWEVEKAEEWRPTPLEPEEVALILQREKDKRAKKPTELELSFGPGDSVKVTQGTFAGLTGPVTAVDPNGAEADVSVTVKILGREVTAKVKHWQVELL